MKLVEVKIGYFDPSRLYLTTMHNHLSIEISGILKYSLRFPLRSHTEPTREMITNQLTSDLPRRSE